MARSILLVQGPNLNLLGTREPALYGTTTLAQINDEMTALAASAGATLIAVQSNFEGELVATYGARELVLAGKTRAPTGVQETASDGRDLDSEDRARGVIGHRSSPPVPGPVRVRGRCPALGQRQGTNPRPDQ